MVLMFGRLQALVPSEATPPKRSEEQRGEISNVRTLWIEPLVKVYLMYCKWYQSWEVTKHNSFVHNLKPRLASSDIKIHLHKIVKKSVFDVPSPFPFSEFNVISTERDWSAIVLTTALAEITRKHTVVLRWGGRTENKQINNNTNKKQQP